MIDLHMHTKHSDGDYTLEELIKILNEKNILYASITDHNNVDAHIEYEDKHFEKIYKGKMIKGVELQTFVGDYLIEVLVYDYDLLKFKKYIDETRRKFWKFHNEAYKKLLEIGTSMGLKYIEPIKELQNGYYANMKFQEAINARYQDNIKIVSHEVLTDLKYFYYQEFQNINSPFYINNKKAFPLLEEVIKNAHKNNGKVFLAHLDEYQEIKDKEKFLKELIQNYDIDGIECFHPSINNENRKKYMKIAYDSHLLISAGSDFHGPHLSFRKNINTEAKLDEIEWLKKIEE